jgi:hypothetical protein
VYCVHFNVRPRKKRCFTSREKALDFANGLYRKGRRGVKVYQSEHGVPRIVRDWKEDGEYR